MYSVKIESGLCGCGEKKRSMVRDLKAKILNKWSKAGSPPPYIVLNLETHAKGDVNKILGHCLFFVSCFLFILVFGFVSFLFGFGFGFTL